MNTRTVLAIIARPSLALPSFVVLVDIGEVLDSLEPALHLPQFGHTTALVLPPRSSRRPLRPPPPSPPQPFPLVAAAEPLVAVAEPLAAAPQPLLAAAVAVAVAAAEPLQPLVSALLRQPPPPLEFLSEYSPFLFVLYLTEQRAKVSPGLRSSLLYCLV